MVCENNARKEDLGETNTDAKCYQDGLNEGVELERNVLTPPPYEISACQE